MKEIREIIKVVRMTYSGMIRVYRKNDTFEYHQYEGWALVPKDVIEYVSNHSIIEHEGF